MFSLHWLMDIVLNFIGINNYLLRMFLTLLIFSGFQAKLWDKSIYLIAITVILRLIADKTVYSFDFLVEFIIILCIWRFIASFATECVAGLGKRIFSKDIAVSELLPNMILCEVIEKEGDGVSEEKVQRYKQRGYDVAFLNNCCFIKRPKANFESNVIFEEEPEGLTGEQVELIKRLGFERVRIAKTIPFATIIFIGVILTLLAKGNILILLPIR